MTFKLHGKKSRTKLKSFGFVFQAFFGLKSNPFKSNKIAQQNLLT